MNIFMNLPVRPNHFSWSTMHASSNTSVWLCEFRFDNLRIALLSTKWARLGGGGVNVVWSACNVGVERQCMCWGGSMSESQGRSSRTVCRVAAIAGIPRRRHGHRHRLAIRQTRLQSYVWHTLFLARPREKIACVGRKIVAVFGESVSVSVSVLASWNATLCSTHTHTHIHAV